MVLKLAISETVAAGMMDGSIEAPLRIAWIKEVCMVEALTPVRPMASHAALMAVLSTPKM